MPQPPRHLTYLRSIWLLLLPLLSGCIQPSVALRGLESPSSQHRTLGFQFSDPEAWRHEESGALELHKKSSYRPKVRSPHSIAVLDGYEFEDFVLDVDAQQHGIETAHRDLCFFFGMRSPSQFYYVHIAKKADPHAHNVFLVDNKPRVAIADQTTDGVDWGRGVWHHIRIVRRVKLGQIEVYFDDMLTPIMRANDPKHGWGMVGLGSFDDSGRFRNLRIRGTSRKTEKQFF